MLLNLLIPNVFFVLSSYSSTSPLTQSCTLLHLCCLYCLSGFGLFNCFFFFFSPRCYSISISLPHLLHSFFLLFLLLFKTTLQWRNSFITRFSQLCTVFLSFLLFFFFIPSSNQCIILLLCSGALCALTSCTGNILPARDTIWCRKKYHQVLVGSLHKKKKTQHLRNFLTKHLLKNHAVLFFLFFLPIKLYSLPSSFFILETGLKFVVVMVYSNCWFRNNETITGKWSVIVASEYCNKCIEFRDCEGKRLHSLSATDQPLDPWIFQCQVTADCKISNLWIALGIYWFVFLLASWSPSTWILKFESFQGLYISCPLRSSLFKISWNSELFVI